MKKMIELICCLAIFGVASASTCTYYSGTTNADGRAQVQSDVSRSRTLKPQESVKYMINRVSWWQQKVSFQCILYKHAEREEEGIYFNPPIRFSSNEYTAVTGPKNGEIAKKARVGDLYVIFIGCATPYKDDAYLQFTNEDSIERSIYCYNTPD